MIFSKNKIEFSPKILFLLFSIAISKATYLTWILFGSVFVVDVETGVAVSSANTFVADIGAIANTMKHANKPFDNPLSTFFIISSQTSFR